MLQHFFNMGGYGAYVWSAYAVVSVVLLANLIVAYTQKKQTLRDVRQKIKRHESNS
jgi:heme exporter protein D